MKRYLGGMWLVLLCASAPFSFPSQVFAEDLSLPVKEIRIKGAVRTDNNTVRYYIHSKVGEPYNADTVGADIKRIFALGFFDEISIDVTEESGSLILTYVFIEKPFVKEIILTGIEEIEQSAVDERLKTQKGTFFRQDQIPWDRDRIKQVYRNKGFYFTEVTAVVHKLADHYVNVEYVIDEGKKITIGRVVFRGNEAFSDRVLQGSIETASGGWQSVLSDTGAYRKDALKTDVLRLESFYHDNGYLKVRVFDPEVEIDKEKGKIYVTFPVSEGTQYRVGTISIVGDEVYTEDELLEKIELEPDDVFNRSMFRKDVFEITDMYSQKGFAFASVIPSLNMKDETKTVDVKIRTTTGRKVYIGRITIVGNDSTRDRVIRREFRLSEGELFNSAKLRRSRQRINNLGFFESVEIEQRSSSEEDLIDIEVKVVERNTGQISFALGYSSVENILIQGQVKWTNLLGRGQELAVTLDSSSRRTDFTLSFTEPAIFDRPLSAGIDLYNKVYNYDSYESTNTGASLRMGKGLGEFLWGRVGYKYERNVVDILNEDLSSAYLRAQEGESVVGAIYPSLTYDSRNDPYSPSAGQRISTFVEVSGLGGNELYYKTTAEYTTYKKLYLGFVGMFHAKIGKAEGYGGEELPIFKRFFLGGPRSLRGFTFKDIGPKDESGDTIGGESLLQFNTELQYGFTKYFRGFLFYDRGNVYGSNDDLGNTTDRQYDLAEMRHSWGFGIHFFSPVGPISIAYGFKLDQRKDESPTEFHFTIGGSF